MTPFFTTQSREQEPQRRAAEQKRAHDHIMPRVLVSIGQDIVKEVKRSEVSQRRENTVDQVQHLHETSHLGTEERGHAFYQKCDQRVHPEENIHLHRDPHDPSVVRVDQDAEGDPHP